jgi:hypothetical protein
MKLITIVSALLLLSTQLAMGQKFITRTGHIHFYSHTPVEDIEADNHQVTSLLDAGTGNFVFAVLMKSFQFEKALMQEHFNEKYVESDQYPKAEFKGKVANLSEVNFDADGSYPVTVAGDLTLHGVTKPIEAKGVLTIKDGRLAATSTFPIVLADYDIDVPGVVREKISESIETTVTLALDSYGK